MSKVVLIWKGEGSVWLSGMGAVPLAPTLLILRTKFAEDHLSQQNNHGVVKSI